MKGSPGPSLTYSASSEDAASTSGPNQADEASSVEVWLWSHGIGHAYISHELMRVRDSFQSLHCSGIDILLALCWHQGF